MTRKSGTLAGAALVLLMTTASSLAFSSPNGASMTWPGSLQRGPLRSFLLVQGEQSEAGKRFLLQRERERLERRAQQAEERAREERSEEDRLDDSRSQRGKSREEEDDGNERKGKEREGKEREAARERDKQAAEREARDQAQQRLRREAERQAAEERAERSAEREAREAQQRELRREAARREAERQAAQERAEQAAEREAREAEQRELRREAQRREAERQAVEREAARERARIAAEREARDAAIRAARDEAARAEARRAEIAAREEAERQAARAARQAEEAEARLEQQAREARRRLFDSQKERREFRREQLSEPPLVIIEAEPLPRSDREAQGRAVQREPRSVRAEAGVRVERRQRQQPREAEVLQEIGDRQLLRFGDRIVVESSDQPRLSRGAREVFTESLPNDFTRETIIRPDGSQVVTIRDIFGDVIRRSRFVSDGEEQVLAYLDEADFARVREHRDPGEDLPPLEFDIAEDDYIFAADEAATSQDYYDFLYQPPLERLRRLYSLDEVKRSARLRDIVRRVDLDTISFELGSASLVESEVSRLEGVALAMRQLIADYPAETFLIEGHTDAVGTSLNNLALSDRRAEAVAQELTDLFGIPPENLVTQGYGEEYLKVASPGPSRENRRVAIRRITALVSPVASAH